MTPAEQLLDDIIAQGLDALRFAASERSTVDARLRALARQLVALIPLGGFTSEREAARAIAAARGIIADSFPDLDLSGFAEAVAAQVATSLEVVLGREALQRPAANYFKTISTRVLIEGAPSGDWWRGQSADLQFRFAAQVRQGFANGETNAQIVARITGKAGQPGIMETTRRNAGSLVQTSVQAAANDARRKTFKANSDLILGLRQVSTLDGHTSTTCIAYSDQQWDLEGNPIRGTTLPYNGGTPRHWKCRSVEVPILKTFRELGLNVDEPTTTRASSDGQIDGRTTFDGFLKRKGKAYQDRVLGPGRAELWRSGAITLRDLVSGDGSPLTLEQLRIQAGLA